MVTALRRLAFVLFLGTFSVIFQDHALKGYEIKGGWSILVWAALAASTLVVVGTSKPGLAFAARVAEWQPLKWRGFPDHRALPAAKGTDPLRIALFAVRTELAGCGKRLVEAMNNQRWWDPDPDSGDPLPAIAWREHAGALSDPSLPSDVHQLIESAYQKCDRLNHRIRGYITGYKNTHFPNFTIPASVFAFREGDEELVRDTRKRIDAANTAISERVS